MGTNPIPANNGQLIQLANSNLAGLTQWGSSLDITQITPAPLQGEITAFVTADNAFNLARSNRKDASDTYHTAVDALASWLEVARNVLAARFGPRWSTAWAQVGFINNTTAVPRRLADQLTLAQQLVSWFTANPSFEVPNLFVTAANGTALVNTVNLTRQALTDAEMTLETKKDEDIAARAELVATMRALILILKATLEGNDPRWLAFGLNKPASNTTPGQPVNVAASLDGAGDIIVTCDAVPLATRYRWRTLFVGVDDQYTLAGSTTAPLGKIDGVQPGQTVQIIVQAVNVSQQGVASAPIQFTMPPSATARAAEPPVESTLAVPAKGNGNGNGHAATSRVR